jgi:hypothetical protein
VQVQIYVDETKAKGYVVAAAAVVPGDADALRKTLRGLLPRAQRRLHMVQESAQLRRKLLNTLAGENVTVALYVAGPQHGTHIRGRRACLGQLVADAVAGGCISLTFESDKTQDRRDQQDLIEITRRLGCEDLRYVHASPYTEPLLWIPDGVAWAYARGGEWRQLAAPLITSVVNI